MGKKLPEVPVMCGVHPYKNVFLLPNVIPPLVPPLLPPVKSPTRVASPVVGTSERVSECVAREGDTTVQQNRTEKRRGCFGRSNNYYRIFLSLIPCESRTRLVSLLNPNLYIRNIFKLSCRFNQINIYVYLISIVKYRTIILILQSQIKIKKTKIKI